MKRLLLLFVSAIAISCESGSDDNEIIQNGGEQLRTTTLNVSENYQTKEPNVSDCSKSIDFYRPNLPKTFKAYFISKETKNGYKIGELVKTTTVAIGNNKIENLPQLNYTVYVSNFQTEIPLWYTMNNPTANFPMFADELYVYGEKDVNYSSEIDGSVELNSPYSLVQISKRNMQGNISNELPHIQSYSYDAGEQSQNALMKSADEWFFIYTKAKYIHLEIYHLNLNMTYPFELNTCGVYIMWYNPSVYQLNHCMTALENFK